MQGLREEKVQSGPETPYIPPEWEAPDAFCDGVPGSVPHQGEERAGSSRPVLTMEAEARLPGGGPARLFTPLSFSVPQFPCL